MELLRWRETALVRSRVGWRRLGVLGFALIAACWPGIADATTFIVNSSGDTVDASPGDNECGDSGSGCTLRAAVMEANAHLGSDVINLTDGVYMLTIAGAGENDAATGDLDIIGDLVINGEVDFSGQPVVGINGNNIDRVFDVRSGNVFINGVFFSDGAVLADDGQGPVNGGGGVRVLNGSLTLTNCVAFNNYSFDRGGGIHTDGPVTLFNTTLEGNVAEIEGAGMFISAVANVNVISSTISSNSAYAFGGGAYVDGVLTLTNSTVTDNSAQQGGGLYTAGTANLRNATIYYNWSDVIGGGIRGISGAYNSRNSIIGGNFAPTDPDCSTTFYSEGYNLIQDATGCTISGDTTGNIIGQDPLLNELAPYGGPTSTSPPQIEDPDNAQPGSPAIDAGNPAPPGSGGNACEVTDQRGALRLPSGSKRCDIGAVEVWENSCGNGLVEEETDDPFDCDEGGASGLIGPGGGTLASGDGSLSVSIPAGALADPTTIVVAPNAAAKDSQTVANLITAQPTGLTFSQPVTFTVRWDDRDNDGTIDTGNCQPDANGMPGLDNDEPCDADGDCDSGVCSQHTSYTNELDMVLKRDGDRFGSSGYASGPFRCGDHLSGACATATPNCADAPGTNLASVANCCDPASNTWVFQTCSFSEYLTGRREADMVPGKGSLSKDCHAEWRPKNPTNNPYYANGRAGTLGQLNFKQECTDGDPQCDQDKTVNQLCVFEVQVSLNVDDIRLRNRKDQQVCSPLQMKSWFLLKPKPTSTNPVDALNALELMNAVRGMGTNSTPVEQPNLVDFVNPVGSNCDSSICDTTKAKVQVPLGGKHHNKIGVKTIKMRTITPPGPKGKPLKDPDTLKLICRPTV